MKTCADWLWPAERRPADRVPRLVALGGDGIGREVVDAAVQVLEAARPGIEIVMPAHGDGTSGGFPDAAREACDRADAVLFGAAEKASLPILWYLRFGRAAFANIRPAAALFSGDPNVDLVIVRELSEGLYPGREGDLAELSRRWPEFRDMLERPLPREGKFAIRVVTPDATRRIGRHAARLAAYRAKRGKPGRLTIVTKQNILPDTDGLFRAICEEEARAAGVTSDHLLVDEAARRLASRPAQFDVIVTTNLFGDILSDVASEAVGGMPLAPSAGLSEDGFAYFEPVHGSGPDIAGKGVANPIGAILSAAMAVHYLGREDTAVRIVDALRRVSDGGTRSMDMGGRATTAEVVTAVCAELQSGTAR